MRRATVTLPKYILDELLRVTKAKTKTEAVRIAAEDEIRARKIQRIKKEAGHLKFITNAEELRHKDKRLG